MNAILAQRPFQDALSSLEDRTLPYYPNMHYTAISVDNLRDITTETRSRSAQLFARCDATFTIETGDARTATPYTIKQELQKQNFHQSINSILQLIIQTEDQQLLEALTTLGVGKTEVTNYLTSQKQSILDTCKGYHSTKIPSREGTQFYLEEHPLVVYEAMRRALNGEKRIILPITLIIQPDRTDLAYLKQIGPAQ